MSDTADLPATNYLVRNATRLRKEVLVTTERQVVYIACCKDVTEIRQSVGPVRLDVVLVLRKL